MKVYKTNISKEYVPDWEPRNAIRELLQNALDDPSTFEYCFREDKLDITSKGVQLPPSVFALGISGKRNDPNAVGEKGEGLCLALAVLLRAGHEVVIANQYMLWTPKFEYSEDFKCDILVVEEVIPDQDMSDLCYNEDFTVVVCGITEDLKEEILHDCLYLQEDLGEVREGERGRVLLDTPGKLYVGGLFVSEIHGQKYSYDFHPKYLPLNRDRKSVDTWDLATNTSALLEEVFPPKEVAQMAKARVRDVGFYHIGPTNPMSRGEAYKLFQEEHGKDAIVVADYLDKKKLARENPNLNLNIVVISDTVYRQMIEQSEEYKHNLEILTSACAEGDNRTPVQMLEDWFNDDNQHDSEFEELIELFKERGVSWDE